MARKASVSSKTRVDGRGKAVRAMLPVALAFFGMVVGCGGEENGSAASTAEDAPETLIVSAPPILDAAPYFWALDTGMFDRQGLTIKNHRSAGGAADIPALISGDFHIASSNTVSALIARSKGLPIRFVAGGATGLGPKEKNSGPLMVAPDSPIDSPHDLADKTIAVNTVGNIDQLYTEAWLRGHGVDPTSLKFVEVGFSDQPAALLEGRVQAVRVVTPFAEKLESQGAQVLGYPYQIQPRVFISGWIAHDEFASQHPTVISKFQSVFDQAITEMQRPANHRRLTRILEKRTGLSKDVLKNATFPGYIPTADAASLSKTVRLMEQEGLVDDLPDAANLVNQLVGRQ